MNDRAKYLAVDEEKTIEYNILEMYFLMFMMK